MEKYWIICVKSGKFNGKDLVYSKRNDWTTKGNEYYKFKTYQKAYAVLKTLDKENCEVIEVEN